MLRHPLRSLHAQHAMLSACYACAHCLNTDLLRFYPLDIRTPKCLFVGKIRIRDMRQLFLVHFIYLPALALCIGHEEGSGHELNSASGLDLNHHLAAFLSAVTKHRAEELPDSEVLLVATGFSPKDARLDVFPVDRKSHEWRPAQFHKLSGPLTIEATRSRADFLRFCAKPACIGVTFLQSPTPTPTHLRPTRIDGPRTVEWHPLKYPVCMNLPVVRGAWHDLFKMLEESPVPDGWTIEMTRKGSVRVGGPGGETYLIVNFEEAFLNFVEVTDTKSPPEGATEQADGAWRLRVPATQLVLSTVEAMVRFAELTGPAGFFEYMACRRETLGTATPRQEHTRFLKAA